MASMWAISHIESVHVDVYIGRLCMAWPMCPYPTCTCGLASSWMPPLMLSAKAVAHCPAWPSPSQLRCLHGHGGLHVLVILGEVGEMVGARGICVSFFQGTSQTTLPLAQPRPDSSKPWMSQVREHQLVQGVLQRTGYRKQPPSNPPCSWCRVPGHPVCSFVTTLRDKAGPSHALCCSPARGRRTSDVLNSGPMTRRAPCACW